MDVNSLSKFAASPSSICQVNLWNIGSRSGQPLMSGRTISGTCTHLPVELWRRAWLSMFSWTCPRNDIIISFLGRPFANGCYRKFWPWWEQSEWAQTSSCTTDHKWQGLISILVCLHGDTHSCNLLSWKKQKYPSDEYPAQKWCLEDQEEQEVNAILDYHRNQGRVQNLD